MNKAGFLTTSQEFLVSQQKLESLENERIQKMRKESKLCLILDLDHTLVHVMSPTAEQIAVGLSSVTRSSPSTTDLPKLVQVPMLPATKMAEFMQYNTLDESVIYEFFLPMIHEHAKRASPHWMRLRPGLVQFLNDCKGKFDLYLYTHGIKSYAEAVLAIIDPTYEIFGNPPRIFSREISTTLNKVLTTIFPCEHSLCVVIDDRDDVWPPDMPNLIKVSPFRYFHDAGRDKICLEGWLRAARQEPSRKRAAPGDSEPVEKESLMPNEVRVALASCDGQLKILMRLLLQLKASTYESLESPGDVRQEISAARSAILKDCVVVTSGIIPQKNAHHHILRRTLQQLGARIEEVVTAETTHVLASRQDTKKVYDARQMNDAFRASGQEKRIHIVTPNWLENVIATWGQPRPEFFSFKRQAEKVYDGDHWYSSFVDKSGRLLPWPTI